MESEIKVIIKKKDGNYKTPSYIRKAVRDYEQRLKELYPERYQQRLEKHREYHKKRREKLNLALEKSLFDTQIKVC